VIELQLRDEDANWIPSSTNCFAMLRTTVSDRRVDRTLTCNVGPSHHAPPAIRSDFYRSYSPERITLAH